MGRIGPLQTIFTARGLTRYRLEVWHDELKRYSMLRGDNVAALVSQAQARVAQWDAVWLRRTAIAATRHNHDQKRALALTQTQEAADLLAELEKTLSSAVQHKPIFNWETLKDCRPFPEAKPVAAEPPQEPPRPSLPPEPLRDEAISIHHAGFSNSCFHYAEKSIVAKLRSYLLTPMTSGRRK